MRVAGVRTIRCLSAAESQGASDILMEAASWSATHHAPLWSPEEVSAAQCLTWAHDDVLYGGFDDDQLATVFCLHFTRGAAQGATGWRNEVVFAGSFASVSHGRRIRCNSGSVQVSEWASSSGGLLWLFQTAQRFASGA